MAVSIQDNYDGTATPYIALTIDAANDWGGQTFTASADYDATRVDIWAAKGIGDTVGTVTVAIYAVDGSSHPTGSALASGTFTDTDIDDTTNYKWVQCDMSSPVSLSQGTEYAVVVHGASLSAANVLIWSFDDDGAGGSDYANGDQLWSTDGGSSWLAVTTQDQLFRVYGSPSAIDEKVYSRKLVAIGGNELWYESSASTMTEFVDANGDISTSNVITAVEAFQKIFIANQTNLKVTDFVNTKITTADVGANPPDFGTVLTGGTSAASMVVDYITTLSSACVIYGKRTTSATFVDTETVTGTDDDSNAISFALNANEDAPPHWYDWTPFGNDTSFGAMPTSAYLVTRYRGRLVLSGHPDYPHMWYMSKVANPWNWNYSETTRLSAVAGNNVNAGEIGDIVRVMIPYGDDFLIFGCANSIHLLDGDPIDDGTIDELSSATGIYSFTSWCKDEDGNLYFYGRDGIYKMQGGRSRPVNISKGSLPALVSDWAVDPSLHRIVMAYDIERRGIYIFKTTLSDGTCVGYMFSLETDGFYPITLDTTNGVFSAYEYNSDTPADRGLLLGSYDGYIRSFTDAQKNDDIGGSNKAISSYFGVVENLSEDEDTDAVLQSLSVELAGGASGGDFADSDGCTYEYHTADDAETALEHLRDGATARESGTLSGTGRKDRIRKRLRAAWIAIKFYNSTASETFGINRLYGIIKQIGRIK
jgi:hypothetical protein